MVYERVQKSSARSPQQNSAIAPVVAQPRSLSRHTQQSTENQAMQKYKHEATILEIQAKYGTITPQEQERLTFIQAKMADYRQRMLDRGNRVSQHLFNSIASNVLVAPPERNTAPPIQPKFIIGQPRDKYEQEAHCLAKQFVNRFHAPTSQHETLTESKNELQTMPKISSIQPMLPTGAGMTAPKDLEVSIQQAQGGGQPLPDKIKQLMKQAFGIDCSPVRVHTDARANEINQKLQSRACIMGQDMFFRYGEYNPDTPDGLETIIHECVHYEQQSQAQNQIGFKGVIQRNVGFEFEVGAYEVKQIVQETEATELRSEDLSDANLNESDVLARGDGFELQVDTGVRGAHLEFVTSGNGFPETKAGRRQLKTAMEGIVALGNEITDKTDTSSRTYNGQGVISTREITNGLPTSSETVIHGIGNPMIAEPQTTAGIRLDRLSVLMENMVSPENESTEERQIRLPQRFTLAGKSNRADVEVLQQAPRGAEQAITNFKTQMISDSIELPPKFGSESLVGLMALIYTYLKKATLPVVDYSKSLFPLLSHTNFSSMFAMLPDNDRAPFIEDPQRFVNINLNAAQMVGTGGTAFYTGGFPFDPSLNAWSASITRQSWLYNIPQGTDQLNDLAKFGDRREQVGQTHLFKDDSITDAPILELRRIKGDIGINNWKDLALDVFDFIVKFNDLKTQRFESRRFNIRNQK